MATPLTENEKRNVEGMLAESHWMARGRAWLLSLLLVAVNLIGIAVTTLAVNQWRIPPSLEKSAPVTSPKADSTQTSQIRPPTMFVNLPLTHASTSTRRPANEPADYHWPAEIYLISVFATTLAGVPMIAFLTIGWYARYHEFQNSLKEAALRAYLTRFWSKRLNQAIQYASGSGGVPASTAKDDATQDPAAERSLCDRLFARIYHEQYGLSAFIPPYCILLAFVYAAGAIGGWVYWTNSCAAPTQGTCVFGLSTQLIIASLAGAFMFVVSDSVLSIRRRALNVTDIYWYSLRLFLAVPLGLVANQLPGSDGVHVLFAFALGTLPVDELIKVIRRVASAQTSALEKAADAPDQLLNLSGVTIPVAATLKAEGIESIEQMGAADPVTLAIRTGFTFRFTLQLASQAIVRRHLGKGVDDLIPIGLAAAVPIWLLVQVIDGKQGDSVPAIEKPDDVVSDAAARLLPNDKDDQRIAVVRMKFRQIAAEEYTLMLAKITPLDPSL